MRPYSSIAAWITFSAVPSSSRSAGTTIPSPPAALTASRPSFSLSSRAGGADDLGAFAPEAARTSARPMPLLAPEMTATLPARRPLPLSSLISLLRWR